MMTITTRHHLTTLAAVLLTAWLAAACSADADIATADGRQDGAATAATALCYNAGVADVAVTRSTPLPHQEGNIFPRDRVFKVWAFNHVEVNGYGVPEDKTLIDGDIVKWRGWFWSTENNYMWPADSTSIDIYAVWPPDVAGRKGAWDGDSVVTCTLPAYTVTTVNARQTDLLATKATRRKQPYLDAHLPHEVYDVEGAVNLDFWHILCQVSFQGRLARRGEDTHHTDYSFDNWRVDVSHVELCNIARTGTFQYNQLRDDGTLRPTGPATTVNGYDVWTDYADTKTTAHPLGYATDAATYVAPMLVGTTVASPVHITSSTTPTMLTRSDDVLMLIPQRCTPWNPATESVDGTDLPNNGDDRTTARPRTRGTYIHLRCHIWRTDNGNTWDMLGTASEHADVYCPIDTHAWAPGKHILYTLIFGGHLDGYEGGGERWLTDLEIDTQIEPWKDGGTTDTDGVRDDPTNDNLGTLIQ